jgi:hypothetical protein
MKKIKKYFLRTIKILFYKYLKDYQRVWNKILKCKVVSMAATTISLNLLNRYQMMISRPKYVYLILKIFLKIYRADLITQLKA